MRQLWVCMLVSALALATFSKASPKPKALLQDTPSGPEAIQNLRLRWPTALGSPSYHWRQLYPQDLPHLMTDLSKKQGPWVEEDATYGWMNFGPQCGGKGPAPLECTTPVLPPTSSSSSPPFSANSE